MQEPSISSLETIPTYKSSTTSDTSTFSDFSSLLFWQGAVPTVSTPHSIDNIKTTQDPYTKLVAIGVSVEDQIEKIFLGSAAASLRDLAKHLESVIGTPDSNTLEAALNQKRTISEIQFLIQQNRCWREDEVFFGVNALTLSRNDRPYLFAAYVETLEEPLEGTSRNLYERYLLSLTAAYIKRIAVEAITILDKASQATDFTILRILDETEEVARTVKIPINQGMQLGTVLGSIAVNTSKGFTFEEALRYGIQKLAVLGETLFSRATAVGLGALLYSPALGNGERHAQTSLSLPVNALLPELPDNLEETAASSGTVDLPFRIFAEHSQYSLVATTAKGSVSAQVPVRMLTLDPTTASYSFTTSDSPPTTLSFPIVHPDSSSTVTPSRPAKVTTYTGVTLKPLLVQPQTLPAADLPDFRDCIYCFPVESGIAPIYIVFNTPYAGATTKGKFSGRAFNPAKAGGPVLDLQWSNATVTQEGIDAVKLYTGRFNPSDANTIMIFRLEKILQGEISITDTDKRFYTHELRELERFRALGVPDNKSPNDDGTIWNNAHTATLEDYKLKDSFELLYTADAIEADDRQLEREYTNAGRN